MHTDAELAQAFLVITARLRKVTRQNIRADLYRQADVLLDRYLDRDKPVRKCGLCRGMHTGDFCPKCDARRCWCSGYFPWPSGDTCPRGHHISSTRPAR